MRVLHSPVTTTVTSTLECFISKRGEVHTMKAHRRSRGIAPVIRRLGCRRRWVVSLPPRSPYPRGRVFYFVDLIWFVAIRLNRWRNGQRESVIRNVLAISTLTNVLKFYTAVYRSPTVKFLICFMLSNATAGCDAIFYFLPSFITKNLITVHYVRTYSVPRCMLVSY